MIGISKNNREKLFENGFLNKGIEKPGVQFNPNQLSNIKQLHPDLKLPLMMTNISKTGRTGRGGGGEREGMGVDPHYS